MNIQYIWAKLLKKLRGSAILNSQIHKTSKIEAGSQVLNSTMGKYSFCGYNCQILNSTIGAFCSIANNVAMGGERHPYEWVAMSPVFYEGSDSVKKKFATHKRVPSKSVIIEHDVWIGERVLISQGVRIGTGAVVGMGSIVTKDVKPYSIVAGCPAREIKKRFEDEVISDLLKSKWWELEDNILEQHAQYIKNPRLFLEKLKS